MREQEHSPGRQILNRYVERFEIEEAFKDVKWLQRLEWQRVKKPEVIRILLLFVFLGWWLLWRYATPDLPKQKIHPKKRLSWFKQAWEYLQWLTPYATATTDPGGSVTERRGKVSVGQVV